MRGRPTALSEDSGALKPRLDAVPDQDAPELADGGHDVENHLARRRGGVDGLLGPSRRHPAAAEMVERFAELLDGVRGPVEAL